MKIEVQPEPIKRAEEYPVVLQVIEDLTQRAKVGHKTYGTLLTKDNGRDQLVDAYHEALDLAIYLRAAIEERDQKQASPELPEVVIDFLNELCHGPVGGENYVHFVKWVMHRASEIKLDICVADLERLWREGLEDEIK